MKPRPLTPARIALPLASAVAALLATHSATAQTTRYWDNNGTTTGFGSAGGTWTAPTISQWSTSSVGTATPGASITTLINDPLHFGTDVAGGGLGSGTITVTGTVNAASLRFGSQTTGSVTLSGGTINLAAATTLHTGAGGTTNHNITSSITGASTSLTKTGNTLTLSGANSYTGTTIISTGTLILNNLSALGSTTGVTIGGAAGATLSSALSGITVTAPITTANTGITSTIAFATTLGGSFALNGAIGGNGNVAYTTPNVASGGNTNTINLGVAGTYAGSTSINTGNINNNLVLRNASGAANVLPTSTVLNFGTGLGPAGATRATTLDLNGQNQTLAGLGSLAAVAVPNGRNHRVSSTAAATLTINSTADQTFGGTTVAGSLTTSAQIAGAISLVKNGAGTFTLGGLLTGTGATASGNTFTGSTTVLGGILVLGESTSIRNSAFDTTASVTGTSTAGLRTTVTTLTLGGLNGNKNFSDVFTTTTGGYGGLTALTFNPGTGVINSYSADIGDGATGMSLTKTGAGTQVLTGSNTHTGSTTVSAGVLAVNGSLANTSTTTVSGAGTLKGSGSIASDVTVGSGGTLASGTSIESLAVGGNLSFTTGSSFEYELDKDAAANEAGDLTAVTGSLSLAGTVTLNLVETGVGSWELGSPLGDHFGSPAADKLTLISYNGTWNGGMFTYLGNLVLDDSEIFINGQQWFFNYNDTDAGINYTGDLGSATRFVTLTVPEPNVAALFGGLGMLALIRRRR